MVNQIILLIGYETDRMATSRKKTNHPVDAGSHTNKSDNRSF